MSSAGQFATPKYVEHSLTRETQDGSALNKRGNPSAPDKGLLIRGMSVARYRPIQESLWIIFSFCSPTLEPHVPPTREPRTRRGSVQGLPRIFPAPVESMPSQPVAAKCPLCHEHRRYLPSEVFLGRLSHLMIRKPVRSADGRVG